MTTKFDSENEVFFRYLDKLVEATPDLKEVLANFPAYVGHVNLARFLSLSDSYRRIAGLAGDIGDFGTYKGGSFFTLAKLVRLFEPYSNTTVHGFDWFKGQIPGPNDDKGNLGLYKSSKSELERLINDQGLAGLMELHDLDLVSEMEGFFTGRPWLRFKLAFVDIGIESVLSSVLPGVWDRLVPGGVLILDHFSESSSPRESDVLMATIGAAKVEQAVFSRSPTAFVYKPTY